MVRGGVDNMVSGTVNSFTVFPSFWTEDILWLQKIDITFNQLGFASH
jgi:hypothetical protein